MNLINNPYETPVHGGYPFLDYQELEKTLPELVFLFRIEVFLRFILKEIVVTYPAIAVSNNTQFPLKVTANVSSTQNLFTPIPVPIPLFSSPSENFGTGALNDDPQGMRFIPLRLDYPLSRGDVLTVTVTGTPTGLLMGCLIHGRKYGAQYGGER
jgi:hypothetical protein